MSAIAAGIVGLVAGVILTFVCSAVYVGARADRGE